MSARCRAQDAPPRVRSLAGITLSPACAPRFEAYLAALTCGHFFASRKQDEYAAAMLFHRVAECRSCTYGRSL